MNIFYLDRNPQRIAKYLCDQHCVKMVLESTQMLCTAHRVLSSPDICEGLYRPTHINHPCNKWTRAASSNYAWHYLLLLELMKEYRFRYRRIHACEKFKERLKAQPQNIKKGKFTDPPQVMPDCYKGTNTTRAYRNYYQGEKLAFAQWKFRPQPFFLKDNKETN